MKTVAINIAINTKNAIKSMAELNNELGGAIATVQDLKLAADAMSKELESTEFGTERFNELKQALIDVNSKIKDYELSIEALDSEQVASEIKSVVGGLTDMAAGFTLIGVSSQSMEKVIQMIAKVEGASKIVTGAMEAWISTQKLLNNATATGALTGRAAAAATWMQAVAAKAAAVGMRILNAVMNANPVVQIVIAITALVGAIGWFVTSTNEAAEAQDSLNLSMEAQNKILESTRRLRASMLADETSYNTTEIKAEQASLKALQLELENFKKKISLNQKLTAVEQERFKQLPGYIEQSKKAIEGFTLDNLTESVESARKSVEENADAMTDKFTSLRFSIEATRDEDWFGEDIVYEKMLSRIDAAEESFKNLNERMQAGDTTTEFYKKAVSNLSNEVAVLNSDITKLDGTFGNDGTEEWTKAIDAAGELDKGLGDLIQSAVDYNKVQREGVDIATDSGFLGDYLREQETEQQRLADLEKKISDNRKAWADKRKKELQDILDRLKREEDALKELAQTNAELANDEIKLVELSFGDERQKIIDRAIAREEAALQQKFLNSKINEQQFKDELININNNFQNYLLQSEKDLIDAKAQVRDKEIAAIKQRNAEEAAITKEQTSVINANRYLEEVRYQKLIDEIKAQDIGNSITREKELFKIKQQYFGLEADAINKNLKAQQALITETYLAEVNNKDLTTAQKLAIDEKYTSDMVALQQEATTQITQIEVDAIKSKSENYEELIAKISEWTDRVAALVQQSMDILKQAFDNQAAAEAESRNQQLHKESELFKAQLANREISQQEYDNKMRLLEQKKYQQELAARRKAFKQAKAMAIVGAIMGTAQGVISGLANPFPLNIIMAALNGALGIAQIAVIASQKFQAARGGVVPGAPSKRDSVDAYLAPGETVINSESSQMFPQLLSQINQAGGGISLAPEAAAVGNTNGGGQSVFRDNQNQPMIKTYVVETEITDSQRKVNRMERAAEF